MANGVFNPNVIEKANDIMLGEGAVYVDYGEAGEDIIGATQGGSKVDIGIDIKEIPYDGSYGPTKGLRRYIRFVPKLVVNFLKLTYATFNCGLPTTTTDGTDADGTYKKTVFRLNYESTDVKTNISFKGYKQDGKVCLIKLLNALNIDKVSLEFKGEEVVAQMTYTGFYTYAAPTTPPIEIWDYV